MIEGHDTLTATYEKMVQHIYDLLPADSECQRLFMLWKDQFKALCKLSHPVGSTIVSGLQFRECSATYAELKMNMAMEGVEFPEDCG